MDRMRSNGDGYQLRTVRAEGKARRKLATSPFVGEHAIFHWNCFIALMKSHGEAGAEQMTWQGDGHAPLSLAEVRNGKRESTK